MKSPSYGGRQTLRMPVRPTSRPPPQPTKQSVAVENSDKSQFGGGAEWNRSGPVEPPESIPTRPNPAWLVSVPLRAMVAWNDGRRSGSLEQMSRKTGRLGGKFTTSEFTHGSYQEGIRSISSPASECPHEWQLKRGASGQPTTACGGTPTPLRSVVVAFFKLVTFECPTAAGKQSFRRLRSPM